MIYADNAATTKMSKTATETMIFHIKETWRKDNRGLGSEGILYEAQDGKSRKIPSKL